MSYNVKNTRGNLLAVVQDGSLDRSSSLRLVGIGYSAYSEIIAEDLVQLLENFANDLSPLNPVEGQLWYSTKNTQLYVYSGGFRTINNVVVNDTRPALYNQTGDFWYDNSNKQLKVYDAQISDYRPLAPAYTLFQGKSGQEVIDIPDNTGINHTITTIYNNSQLIGAYCFEPFTLLTPLGGLHELQFGFNLCNGSKIIGTSTNSDDLGGAPATSYMRTDQDTGTTGHVAITNDSGLSIGGGGDFAANVYTNGPGLFSTYSGASLGLYVTSSAGELIDAMVAQEGSVLFANNLTAPGITTNTINAAQTLVVNGTSTFNTDIIVDGTSYLTGVQAHDLTVKNILTSDAIISNTSVFAQQVQAAYISGGNIDISAGNLRLDSDNTGIFQGNNAFIVETTVSNLSIGYNPLKTLHTVDLDLHQNALFSNNVGIASTLTANALTSGNITVFGVADTITGSNNLNLVTVAGYTSVTNLNSIGYVNTNSFSVYGTGDSSSPSTGSATIAGGLGVSKNISSGGSLSVANDAVITGNITCTYGNITVFSGGISAGTTPGAAGTIKASDNIFAFSTSDSRLKQKIEPISDAMKKVQQISGVEFEWTDEYLAFHGGEDNQYIRRRDVGVIAQQVEQILPEAVISRDNGYLAVDYDKLVPLLLQAIKELNERIEQLESRHDH
jgi:Chaperone of endosialidase